jgi:hypothetical protein
MLHIKINNRKYFFIPINSYTQFRKNRRPNFRTGAQALLKKRNFTYHRKNFKRNSSMKKFIPLLICLVGVTSSVLHAQVIPSIEWQKCLGGTANEAIFSVQQTGATGYIAAGYSDSNDGDVTGNHGQQDYWVVKLNNTGGLEWQKSLGGNSIDQANAIRQTTDGGYIVAGYSYSNNGDVSGNHWIQ